MTQRGSDVRSVPNQDLRPAGALDLELALERVSGDMELLHEIAELFLGDVGRMIGDIDAAVTAKDPHALDRSAHALKGCVASFGAQGVYDAALALERMGRSGDLTLMQPEYQTLRTHLERLESDLRALLAVP
jgi:two-component system, sensor histidine kinase and response regulator